MSLRGLMAGLLATAPVACINFDSAREEYCSQRPFACGAPSTIGDDVSEQPGGGGTPPSSGTNEPTGGCATFDPNKVYGLGRNGVAPMEPRGRGVCPGIPALPPSSIGFVIRPTDKRLLYLRADSGVYVFTADSFGRDANRGFRAPPRRCCGW